MLRKRFISPSTGVFIIVAIALRIASESTANLSYLAVAVYALLGRSQAIQALALSWLLSMLSPGIAPEASQAAIGRYAVIAAAAASVVFHGLRLGKAFRIQSGALLTILLGILLIVHSALFSPMPDVSILKAVSWTIVMATLISAWSSLAVDGREQLIRLLFWGLVVLMVMSLPLLFVPIGYLRNDTGFQGLLNHPQAFGPAMALLGAWAVSNMLAQKKPDWSWVGIAGICILMVVLSEARTAGVALVLAIVLAIFTVPIMTGRKPSVVLPGLRSRRLFAVAACAMVGMVVAAANLEATITNYLSKSGRADVSGLLEAYDTSRGRLIDDMLANIKEAPIRGIGFGIASYADEMEIQRDPVFGLPVSAAIEKGVMPIAVFEELGVIGFVLVAAWIFMLVRRAAMGGFAPTAVTLTVLLLNLGESTFFSPSGLGLLPLILVGWAFSCGRSAPVKV